MTLSARPWHGLDGLRAALPAWEAVRARLEAPSLCTSPPWVLSHARSYPEPGDVFGWTLEGQGGEPAAVLAFRREPRRKTFGGPLGQRLALRRAILVQDGTFDSDYLDPPIRPGLERSAWETALAELADQGTAEAVVLGCLTPGSASLAALREILRERGTPSREHRVGCPAAELPESFEDYLGGLRPRMRTKVRSALRSAEAESGALLQVETAAELPERLEELFRLHALRWAGLGERGAFADPRRRRFYELLAAELLERGELRLARLELGGATVACQMGAVHGKRYYQLQEGFDPARSPNRVGVALRALSIRALIEEGARSYDFMAGVSRHKTDWGGQTLACVTLAFPLPGLRARLAYRARELLDRWR